MKALLILLCLCSTMLLRASTEKPELAGSSEIKGVLIEEQSSKPIEFASVALLNSMDSSIAGGAISDSLGHFIIKDIKKGLYKLIVSYVGYGRKEIKNIEVRSSKEVIDLGTIIISPNSLQLKGVNIVAERSMMEFHADKQVINAAAVQSAQNGTALELLKNSPAINVDNEDNISLRGSSSFTLLIDGKPISINAKDALKQMPASSIDKIEIITNPSSKYDAEGTGGIINVVTKKIKSDGFSALINAKAGTFGKYSGDASFNWNKGKWNFNGMIGYNRDQREPWSRNEQESYVGDTTYYLNWESDRKNLNTNAFAMLNSTYTPNKNNVWGFNVNASKMSWGMDLSSRYESYTDPTKKSNYVSDYYFVIPGNNIGLDISYSHIFDTSAKHLDVVISQNTWLGTVKHHSEQFVANEFYDRGFKSLGSEFFEDSKQMDQRAKIDYTGILFKTMNIETGYQYTSRPYEADFTASRYNSLTTNWDIDSTLSSNEDFDQINHAAYLILSKSIKDIEFSAGIRAEHQSNIFRLDAPHYNDISLSYFNWFPSFSASKTFKNRSQLQGSYSRRVNYPQDWMIGPTPMYSDGFVYQEGNPFLKPELTDSYEINHVRFLRKKHLLSTTLYYRHTKDALSRTMSVNSSGVMIVGWENFATNDFVGLEIGANFNFSKKWSINISADGYVLHNKGELASTSLNYTGTSFNGRSIINYKLSENTRVQLTGVFNAGTKEMQGNKKSQGMINISFRQDFFKQKLSATLNFQDAFNLFRWNYSINAPGYTMRVNFIPEYPAISLGLSYKINNFRQTIRNENAGGPGVGI